MIGVALLAVAAAASAQPAHPARVAEALAPAVDRMLVQVFDGPARVTGVTCTASVINGVQSRAVRCQIATAPGQKPGRVTVVGTLGPGACLRPRVFETFEGRVTVGTWSRGTWCYRFQAVGR